MSKRLILSGVDYFLGFLLPLFFLFMLAGCASSVIKISGFEPDLIKQHKSFIVWAGSPGMHNTGIEVNKGDYFSILAKGNIKFNLKYSSGPERHLLIRVGKNDYAYGYLSPFNSFSVYETGTIYLGYGYLTPGYTDAYGEALNYSAYFNTLGRYDVDIIVWQKEDPVRIADFLEKAILSEPKNKALKDLFEDFKHRKEIVLAAQKANKDVEEAQNAILALKEEKAPAVKEIQKEESVSEASGKKLQEEAKQVIEDVEKKKAIGIKDMEKEKQMAELTDKLQKALRSLNELEELKKKLAEEQEQEKRLRA